MMKKVPKLKSYKDAEVFLEQDLIDYIDLKNFTQVSFEFLPLTKKVLCVNISETLDNRQEQISSLDLPTKEL